MWAPTIGPNGPRYAAIVEALANDIDAGRLAAGDQLPTHRELADKLGVSVGTVTRAYAAAERRGLIRGEIGRGTFVTGGATEAFGAVDFDKATPGIVDLSVTRPLEHLDPDLTSTLRELARQPELSEYLRYQPNAGMWRHRVAGANWVSRFGVEASTDRVLVCAGTQHALNVVASTILGPGDTLFVEELTYPGFRVLANLLQLKLTPLPMDADGLLPDAFESACRQRRGKALFTVPTIHNPATMTIPEDRRREIASIANRYGVAIIEDAIHHLLASNPPAPISVYAPEKSYFIGALSKVVTGGLRVAYLVTPPGQGELLTQSVWATNWMTAPICGEIARMWIEDGTADRTVHEKRIEANRRVRMARNILAGYDLRTDDHGHHAWLELPETWDSAARFAAETRRRGVAVTPADVFAVGGNVPSAVRLSLSAPSNFESLSSGLITVAQTLRSEPGLGPAIV
jgi:DNA-binding transcriptional MocR family regulator